MAMSKKMTIRIGCGRHDLISLEFAEHQRPVALTINAWSTNRLIVMIIATMDAVRTVAPLRFRRLYVENPQSKIPRHAHVFLRSKINLISEGRFDSGNDPKPLSLEKIGGILIGLLLSLSSGFSQPEFYLRYIYQGFFRYLHLLSS